MSIHGKGFKPCSHHPETCSCRDYEPAKSKPNMIKFKLVRSIELRDWDTLVTKTYGRPYSFQQQDGCQSRGTHEFTVPDEETYDEDLPLEIPEVVNGDEMGVRFESWLARDPNQKLPGKNDQDDFSLRLFWQRNFYPDFQTVANDLYAKGLIEEGDYSIKIDW